MSGKLFFSLGLLLCMRLSIFGQEADTSNIQSDINLGNVDIIARKVPEVFSLEGRKITIISGKDIDLSPSATLQDLLEYSAGIDLRQRNIHGVQADIQIRGGSYDGVMILLNGINISDPQTGHFNLDVPIDLSIIDRIEVLHGSGTRIYGTNAFKGVINIITKNNRNQIAIGTRTGQYGLINNYGSAGIQKGIFSSLLSVSRNSSNGYTGNTDFLINNYFFQGGITHKLINVEVQAGFNRKKFGANNFYSPSFPWQYEETGTRFGSFNLNTNGRTEFKVTGFYRSHDDHFLLDRYKPAFYENFHLNKSYGLTLSVGFNMLAGKSLVGFIERAETIKSTSLGDPLAKPVSVRKSDTLHYRNGFWRYSHNFYFDQKYEIQKLTITGGLLLDLYSADAGKISAYPGIDFSYQPGNGRHRIFASLNRANHLPSFTDMFYKDPVNEGYRNLVEEDLFSIETGYDYRSDKLNYGITLFNDHATNVIDWVWLTDINKYKAMNIAEITTRGIEINGNYQFKDRSSYWLSAEKISASYSFIDLGKSTGNYISKYSLDYLKHKLNVSLTGKVKNLIFISLNMAYNDRNGSYLILDNITSATVRRDFKPYFIADARVAIKYRFIAGYLEATNILDKRYLDVGSLVQPGRWITAGAEFNISFRKENSQGF